MVIVGAKRLDLTLIKTIIERRPDNEIKQETMLEVRSDNGRHIADH